ncbi:MAG: hypothetical protein IJC64_03215, partial [Clostridia bacterium]|nr:hypothetical protein [Clostridia bacterium]
MSKIKVTWGAIMMLAISLLSERTDVFLLWGLCALLHEFGHLIAARARGIEIEEIRIDFFGARICTGEGAGSYADEFILCAAGPAVNAAILCAIGIFLKAEGVSLETAARLAVTF